MAPCELELEPIQAEVWEPSRRADIIAWAERELILSGRVTGRPGPYSTAWTPYVREVLRAMADPRTETVVLCWGTQLGKTLTQTVYLAYRLAEDPGPTLWVMPTEALARSFSETRLMPLLESCEPVRAKFPLDSSRIKILQFDLIDSTTNLVGSNSPANISSRPVETVFLDEIDKFAEASEKEAAALALATERTKAFPRRKHIMASTPTLESGDCWQQYLAGTREKYLLACPQCKKEIELVWDHVRWDKDARGEDGKWDLGRVSASAHYACQECGGKITDTQKRSMLDKGRWKATNDKPEPRRRTFHLSSLYSPTISFGQAAVKFLTERVYFVGLQNFVNGWLAMPWQDQFSDEDKPIPAGAFTMRSAWDQAAVGLMGVDVQQDSFYVVVRLFNEKGESRLWLAEKAVSWDQVELIFRSLPAQKKFGCVDSGYRTKEVYRVCSRNNWLAMKGEDGFMGYQHRAGNQTMLRVYAPETLIPEDSCYFMRFRSQLAQDLLAWLRAGQGPEWLVANDAGSEYLDHLKSHRKTNTFSRRTGKVTYEWVRMKSRADHFYDAETMVAVLASYGGLIAAPDPAAEKESDK